LARTSIRAAITLGDPAGIGPEVALKAVGRLRGSGITPLLIRRFALGVRHYRKLIRGFERISPGGSSLSALSPGKRYFLDVDPGTPVPSPGGGSEDTGRESLGYLDEAIGLWKRGLIDVLVTGPVHKGLIEKSGTPFSGHTEYIARAIGEPHPFMMMYSPMYRVLLVTTHIPVGDIAASIDAEAVLRTIRAGRRAVEAIDGAGGRRPRMAIAGLDPHCGDDGAIGIFDRKVTAEAVRTARDEGIDIEGPFSADTLFLPERWKSYGLVIAMYHDQGLIPFKMLAFDTGVNVTLGLPLVRTSVDHGTAFDIAGRGRARHESMGRAIELAARLARKMPGGREGGISAQ